MIILILTQMPNPSQDANMIRTSNLHNIIFVTNQLAITHRRTYLICFV